MKEDREHIIEAIEKKGVECGICGKYFAPGKWGELTKHLKTHENKA